MQELEIPEGFELVNVPLHGVRFKPDTVHIKHFPDGRTIEFYEAEKDQFVKAYDDGNVVWASVSGFSIHRGIRVVIINLTNGCQIISDHDPRAVFGIAAGASDPERFYPDEAMDRGVMVPCEVPSDIASWGDATLEQHFDDLWEALDMKAWLLTRNRLGARICWDQDVDKWLLRSHDLRPEGDQAPHDSLTGTQWAGIESVEHTDQLGIGYDLTVPGYETFMAVDGTILSNTLHLHVPSQDDVVKESYDKLLPSRMLFSIRDQDSVVPVPKQELVLGLYTADKRPAKKRWEFPDEATAMKSIRAGSVPLSDDVRFPGSEEMGAPKVASAQKKTESTIDRLLRAKAESDKRNYPLKHRIMHDLMVEHPEDFEKDKDRGHAQGITHKPSGFRMHLPRTSILPAVTEKQGAFSDTDREQKAVESPEYAPGIPDREDEGDLTKLKPGELLDYVVQEHLARRAGRHMDVRLGDAERGMYSWATRKGLPAESGTPTELFRQPVHSHDYRNFEGNIGEGYGAGTVSTAEKGRALITETGPEGFSFATDRGRWRMIPPNEPGRGWLTVKAGDPPPITHVKEHMQSVTPDRLAAFLDSQREVYGSPKIDGALQILRFRNGKPELFSHRTSKRTGLPIDHTTRVFETARRLEIPKELRNQEFLGELYGERDGKVIPPQELGGILNSGLLKAIETKRDRGIKLRFALHGIAGSGLPHAEKRRLLAEVAGLLPDDTEVVPEVSTKEEILSLLEEVKAGKNPKTVEGIVVVGDDGRPRKVKLRDEADVHIAQTFPGEGRLKGGPGGFLYSDRPGGQLQGRVGTGFDDETRANLEQYIGRTARIGHQGRYHGGAYRAPSFLALHEDIPEKQASEDSSLWDKICG